VKQAYFVHDSLAGRWNGVSNRRLLDGKRRVANVERPGNLLLPGPFAD
jgi:hypothetical protein